MNITFLIGNGFDIGIGLKTRYENFYDEYIKIQEDDNENIKSFKKTLLKWQNMSAEEKSEYKKIVDWADFESAFGVHSIDFKIEEKAKYIERFEHFVMSFNHYIELEEQSLSFTDKDKIVEVMKNAISSFYHIRQGDKNKIQNQYNKFGGSRIYNFISFNYTRTIDRCATILKEALKNESKDVGKICHIHGYVDKNMITGVDNPSQIKNIEFAQDPEIVNEIVKPHQNRDARTNYENEAISLINNSNMICIYGMSIGETDKKWWSIIAKWLLGDKNRMLIILNHDDTYNERFTFLQTKIVNTMEEKFLDLSDLTDDDREEIRKRIFVGINYDIFAMNFMKKEKEPETIVIDITKNVS